MFVVRAGNAISVDIVGLDQNICAVGRNKYTVTARSDLISHDFNIASSLGQNAGCVLSIRNTCIASIVSELEVSIGILHLEILNSNVFRWTRRNVSPADFDKRAWFAPVAQSRRCLGIVAINDRKIARGIGDSRNDNRLVSSSWGVDDELFVVCAWINAHPITGLERSKRDIPNARVRLACANIVGVAACITPASHGRAHQRGSVEGNKGCSAETEHVGSIVIYENGPRFYASCNKTTFSSFEFMRR